ncbi:MAG: oligosaccharide flippase family protein [Anaerolineales bacterium]|nr:oligosaccharide flippase family protein [Anaerolineales bacterium]
MPASLTKRIVRNTLFNFTGRFWAMFLGLLLTPFIVAKLGMAGYGLWSLVLVITNYLLTWDLGLGNALVRHVAHYYARQDYNGLNSVMSTALLLYAALATVAITLTVALRPAVLSAFRVPPEQWEEVGWVLVTAASAFTLGNVLSVFRGFVTGLQQMHLTNLITTLQATLHALGTVAFLQLGYGLKGLALNEIITIILTTALSALLAFRVFPMLRLNPFLLRRETLKMLLNFGLKLQITSLGGLLGLQLNKLLISYFLNLNLLATYELGFKMAYSPIVLLRLLVSAIMPATAELHAQDNWPALRRLYHQGLKYVVAAVIPTTTLVVLSADLITLLWLGQPWSEVSQVIRFLMLAYGLNLFTAMGTAMARGTGRPGYELRYTLVVRGLSLLLGIFLIQSAGLTGLLAATLVAIVLGSLYFLVLWHRFLQVAWRVLWQEVYAKPLLASLVAAAPAYAAIHITRLHLSGGRLFQAIALAISTTLFIAIYSLLLWRSRHWDTRDRRLWYSLVPTRWEALLTRSSRG